MTAWRDTTVDAYADNGLALGRQWRNTAVDASAFNVTLRFAAIEWSGSGTASFGAYSTPLATARWTTPSTAQFVADVPADPAASAHWRADGTWSAHESLRQYAEAMWEGPSSLSISTWGRQYATATWWGSSQVVGVRSIRFNASDLYASAEWPKHETGDPEPFSAVANSTQYSFALDWTGPGVLARLRATIFLRILFPGATIAVVAADVFPAKWSHQFGALRVSSPPVTTPTVPAVPYGMLVWFDTSDLSGTDVSAWDDRSPNGNDVTAVARAPKWDSANDLVVFNGGALCTSSREAVPLSSQSWTIVTKTTSSTEGPILSTRTPSGMGLTLATDKVNTTESHAHGVGPGILWARQNGSQLTVGRDTTSPVSTQTAATNGIGGTIRVGGNELGEYLSGPLGTIVMYPRPLTNSELQQVIDYISAQ